MNKIYLLAATLALATWWCLSPPARVTPRPAVPRATRAAVAPPRPVPAPEVATSAPQAETSVDQVLNAEAGANERWRALFALAKRRDVRDLARVLTATFDARAATAPTEIQLRIHVLDVLDRLASEGVDVSHELSHAADALGDAHLRRFAAVARDGIAAGRPGELTRYFDRLMGEK